jgi:hypothetical protein
MGLVIDPYRLWAGILVESDDIQNTIQKLSHLLLEGIGAGHQVEGGLGGLDGRVALGVVGLEWLPGDNGLALAEGSLLQSDGALAENEGHEDGPDVLSHVPVA